MTFDRNRQSGRTRLRAGHLFWLRAGATWLNRYKARPFALAALHPDGTAGTLVYGSTRETEKRFGAASIEVDPVRDGLHRNGLSSRTFLYPGTLVHVDREALPAPSAFLAKSLVALRDVLRIALGIGRGSCLSPAAPLGSRRGRIVVLRAEAAWHLRTSYAVVLTEHEYSREEHYQVLLPILGGQGQPADEHDMRVTSGDWLALFQGTVRDVLLPVPATMSLWHETAIAHQTEYVVDDGTLTEIDRRLCAYFSLRYDNAPDE